MKFSEMFGTKAATPTAPVAGTPNSDLHNASVNLDAHSNQMSSQGVADKGTAPSPLDGFKGLWDNPVGGAASSNKGFLPEITAEQLNNTLATSNFVSSIPPELMAKAQSGDSAAFSEVLNSMARSVLTQSVLASRGLALAATNAHGEQLRTRLPTMVRSSNVSDSMATNPLYQNPAAKPMIDNLRNQIELKNPHASAKEIASLTDAYIKDFVKMAGGTLPETSESKAKPKATTSTNADTNWFARLGLDV